MTRTSRNSQDCGSVSGCLGCQASAPRHYGTMATAEASGKMAALRKAGNMKTKNPKLEKKNLKNKQKIGDQRLERLAQLLITESHQSQRKKALPAKALTLPHLFSRNQYGGGSHTVRLPPWTLTSPLLSQGRIVLP